MDKSDFSTSKNKCGYCSTNKLLQLKLHDIALIFGIKHDGHFFANVSAP